MPGHPLVGEKAAQILIREAKGAGQEIEIIGSESFIEAVLEDLELGIEDGLKIVDALSMDRVSVDPEVGNLIYQVYDRGVASDVKLKLMDTYPDDYEIIGIFVGEERGKRAKKMPL